MRSQVALMTIVLIAAGSVAAQEDATDPVKVERAVERRAQSWLRDRSTERLRCKRPHAAQACSECYATDIAPGKLDDALWRYLQPSHRRELDRDEWIASFLEKRRGQWGQASLMGDDFALVAVLAARDVTWTTVVNRRSDAAAGKHDAWVSEDGNYFLSMHPGAEDQLRHRWFVEGTSSARAVWLDAIDVIVSATQPDLTDLERAARNEAAEKAVKELETRTIADRGVVANVRPLEAPAFDVELTAGFLTIHVEVRPVNGEDAAALRARLTALSRGTKVYYRGRVASCQARGVSVVGGEVATE